MTGSRPEFSQGQRQMVSKELKKSGQTRRPTVTLGSVWSGQTHNIKYTRLWADGGHNQVRENRTKRKMGTKVTSRYSICTPF